VVNKEGIRKVKSAAGVHSRRTAFVVYVAHWKISGWQTTGVPVAPVASQWSL